MLFFGVCSLCSLVTAFKSFPIGYSNSYNCGSQTDKYCMHASRTTKLHAVYSVQEGVEVLRKVATDKSVTNVYDAVVYIESCDYDSGFLVGGKGLDSAPFSELFGTWKLLYSVEGAEGSNSISTPLVPECRDMGVTSDRQRAQITR